MRKLKHLPFGIFIYYRLWQREILSQASDIAQKEKIDIVHHLTFNEFRVAGRLHSLGIPFVWGPIGGGQLFNAALRQAYFSRLAVFGEFLRNFINHMYIRHSGGIKRALSAARCVLIADQSTERLMPKVRPYRRLLETAYDVDSAGIKSYDLRPDRKLKLLWVGEIIPRKGLKLLIDALGRSDFRDFTLDVVGDGRDKAKCEKLVSRYSLEEHIRFVGRLSYRETNSIYGQYDLLVFTSVRDTSGNVILEGMAHGLPVVTMNHHGAGEIVTADTGTLIDVGSYSAIMDGYISALKAYASDRQLIKRQGEAARERIRSEYSWQKSIDEMLAIYDNIFQSDKKI